MSAGGAPVVALEVAGTLGYAVSGAMAATRRQMDVLGVAVLGVIAATGGTTLRDLLLSQPASWLRHWWPTALAAGTALATIPIALRLGPDVDSRGVVAIADALGLAVFSVLGCLTALNAGTSAGVAVIIGTISRHHRNHHPRRPQRQAARRVHRAVLRARSDRRNRPLALLIRMSVNASFAWSMAVAGVFGLRVYALHRDWTIATIATTKQS
jgi:uncharacterized membrane protein YeiH